MKLRKILSSTVAIVACFAMLSTTAFAASELTLTTGKDGDKVKTTIAGAVEGQVTFLAVDAGTALSDTTAPADMQYIDQQTKESATDVEISFAKRAGGDDKVDIYAGGTNVTEVAVAYGVAVAESATVTGTTAFEVPSNEVPADNAAWATWLQGKVSVAYTALGATAPTTVACTAVNGADFTATATSEAGVHTVAVAYKGMAAGTVTVTETAPAAPITGIVVEGATNIALFVDEALTEAEALAAAKAVTITVSTTHGDSSTKPVTGYTYVWDAATQTVAIAYAGYTSTEKFTFTATKRAYAGVVTSTGALNLGVADIGVTSLEEATDAIVLSATKNMISATGFAPMFTWNDTTVANTAVPAASFDYAIAGTASTSTLKAFTVTVTLKEAAGAVAAGTTLGTIEVAVSATPSAGESTVIKGVVKVSDTTEEVVGFENATPVGAVVTAIQLNGDLCGGNFVSEEGYQSYAAMADATNGAFALEVAPGEYRVFVSHAKFEFFEGELFISRTVKYEEEVAIEEGEEIDLGTVNLKYAFFGDTDLDGDVDSADYGAFAPKVGSSVNN